MDFNNSNQNTKLGDLSDHSLNSGGKRARKTMSTSSQGEMLVPQLSLLLASAITYPLESWKIRSILMDKPAVFHPKGLALLKTSYRAFSPFYIKNAGVIIGGVYLYKPLERLLEQDLHYAGMWRRWISSHLGELSLFTLLNSFEMARIQLTQQEVSKVFLKEKVSNPLTLQNMDVKRFQNSRSCSMNVLLFSSYLIIQDSVQEWYKNRRLKNLTNKSDNDQQDIIIQGKIAGSLIASSLLFPLEVLRVRYCRQIMSQQGLEIGSRNVYQWLKTDLKTHGGSLLTRGAFQFIIGNLCYSSIFLMSTVTFQDLLSQKQLKF